MTRFLTGIIVILVGVILILFFTRKPTQYVIGPTQEAIDKMKSEHKKERERDKSKYDSLLSVFRHDSAMHAQSTKVNVREIKKLKDRANSLLAELNDSLPCIEASEIKSRVIASQGLIIDKLETRILNDSLFTANLKSNFEARLKLQADENERLNEELKLKNQEIAGNDAQTKKKKRKETMEDVLQYSIIGALLYLIGTQ